jgi:hypothetical protein
MPFVAATRFWMPAVRDGGQRRIPVTAAAAVDPTDGDVARAALVRAWSPHERLRIAVLLHALHELRRYPADSRYAQEARRWVVSNDARWPCSFVAICDVLGLDPAAVRARVLGGAHASPSAVLGSQGHSVSVPPQSRQIA